MIFYVSNLHNPNSNFHPYVHVSNLVERLARALSMGSRSPVHCQPLTRIYQCQLRVNLQLSSLDRNLYHIKTWVLSRSSTPLFQSKDAVPRTVFQWHLSYAKALGRSNNLQTPCQFRRIFFKLSLATECISRSRKLWRDVINTTRFCLR